MTKTAEQVLREIVSDYVFRIAQLISENEKLKEDFRDLSTQLATEIEKLKIPNDK